MSDNGRAWEDGRDVIMHFRCFEHSNVMPRGGLTVAAKYVRGEFHAGFAVCSPKDNFCRKRGVAIAVGRLVANGGAAIDLPEYADWDILRARCFHAAMTRTKISPKVRRFLEDHLMCDNLLARRKRIRCTSVS